MFKEKNKKIIPYILCISIFIITVTIIAVSLHYLQQPKVISEFLQDTKSQELKWKYEVLIDGECYETKPIFIDEYSFEFAEKNIQAIKISRTMNEEYYDNSFIDIESFNAGVEIFIDDKLLYSEFDSGEHDKNNFRLSYKKDELIYSEVDDYNNIIVNIPKNYIQRDLSIVTYFSEDETDFMIPFPSIQNDEILFALGALYSFTDTALLVIFAIIAIILSSIFILDISNGSPDYRLILIILFFIFNFLESALDSNLGFYSEFSNIIKFNINIEMYIAPLTAYIALNLTKWRKLLLLSCSISELLYKAIVLLPKSNSEEVMESYNLTLALITTTLILLIIELYKNKIYRKELLKPIYIFSFFIVTILSLFFYSLEWQGNIKVYLEAVISSITYYNFKPLVSLILTIFVTMTIIILVSEFILKTLNLRKMIGVLEERNNTTMECYKMVLISEKITREIKHEMRHHALALSALAKENNIEQLNKYIKSLNGTIDNIPVAVYSENNFINVIVGEFFERAKADNIKTQYQISVPENLNIDNKDLCILLTNMLENAEEACLRLDNDTEKYINLTIKKDDNFLFICCINSTKISNLSENINCLQTEKEDSSIHGYGILAMKKIAEKYNSILKIDVIKSSDGVNEFHIKTNLQLDI